jgi:hypothetical protein
VVLTTAVVSTGVVVVLVVRFGGSLQPVTKRATVSTTISSIHIPLSDLVIFGVFLLHHFISILYLHTSSGDQLRNSLLLRPGGRLRLHSKRVFSLVVNSIAEGSLSSQHLNSLTISRMKLLNSI